MNIFQKYTLKTLKENKTRTVVTIIGIILSVAMFTATTVSFSSGQSFLVRFVENTTGAFHAAFDELSKEQRDEVLSNEEISSYTAMESIGYAKFSDADSSPYLFIAGIDKSFGEYVAYNIYEGRDAENKNEIVLPSHFLSSLTQTEKSKYAIGKKITLNIGRRIGEDGEELGRNDFYQHGSEKLIDTEKRTFTIVGYYERFDNLIESWDTPGYTALTVKSGDELLAQTIFCCYKNIADTYTNLEKYTGSDVTYYANGDLMMFSGYSRNDRFMSLFRGFAAILIAIIVFGSVALIYNSFSISVSERTKQFGILKSIGATRRQILFSVLFEALALCAVAIPIGLASGCLGMWITFKALNSDFLTLLSSLADQVQFKLVVTPGALALAALISVLTALISAFIPASRAIKLAPIEAIRQSTEIKIKRKSVRISPLTKKLFGFEGTVSSKNFKRNKKKYRITVFSLFVSVVLFISATSLCSYLSTTIDGENFSEYDISIYYDYYNSGKNAERTKEVQKKMEAIDAVEKITHCKAAWGELIADKSVLTDKYSSEIGKTKGLFSAYFYFVDDASFKQLLKENGLSEKDCFSSDVPYALLYDRQPDSENNSYYSFLNADKLSQPFALSMVKDYEEGIYSFAKCQEENGETVLVYYGIDEYGDLDETDEKRLTVEQACTQMNMKVGKVIRERPYFLTYDSTYFILPESAIEKYALADTVNGISPYYTSYIITPDHTAVSEEIHEILSDYPGGYGLTDCAKEEESTRAMIKVINVFSVGFIVLISLIAAANVFNTISTNIYLRRREFAMLKSVGLTNKGLAKMMCFESLLYGFKSLAFSLPTSLGVVYLIYQAVIGSDTPIDFFIPWGSFIIAVVSVFVIVFISMIYAVLKIRKDNPVETLRNENI